MLHVSSTLLNVCKANIKSLNHVLENDVVHPTTHTSVYFCLCEDFHKHDVLKCL